MDLSPTLLLWEATGASIYRYIYLYLERDVSIDIFREGGVGERERKRREGRGGGGGRDWLGLGLTRVSTKSFVVLIIRNSKSNHVGAQGTSNPRLTRRLIKTRRRGEKRPGLIETFSGV